MPVNDLDLAGPPGFEQYGAQDMPHGEVPVGRLVVEQTVLESHCSLEMRQGLRVVGGRGCQLSADDLRAALSRCGIEPLARADSLEPEQLLALARELR